MSDSKTTSDTKTSNEDSRVVATEEGFAVGRGSVVNIEKTDKDAFQTVSTIAEMAADLAGRVVANSKYAELRAFNIAEQAMTESQSDSKEILDLVVKKTIPIAVAAWVAVKVFGD